MATKRPRVDATTRFFEDLAGAGQVPLLGSVSGRLRFDCIDQGRTEPFHVTVKRGAVSVSRRNDKAEAVVRADRAVLDAIASGRRNAMAATLRGALETDGDLALVVMFQRLFPGPPASKGRVPPITEVRQER